MLTAENRTRALSILLVLQGGLILVGAVLLGLTGSIFAPLDSVVGADASIAAIVLGAAFILAYRTPNKVWLNLAIMYNALAVVAQLWKGSGGWGIHSTTSTTIVAVIFLVLFLALYPRGEALEMHPGH
jgi:hypothetical protein